MASTYYDTHTWTKGDSTSDMYEKWREMIATNRTEKKMYTEDQFIEKHLYGLSIEDVQDLIKQYRPEVLV